VKQLSGNLLSWHLKAWRCNEERIGYTFVEKLSAKPEASFRFDKQFCDTVDRRPLNPFDISFYMLLRIIMLQE